MSVIRCSGSLCLFVVYFASMSPLWPMKNCLYACVMFPLDSARRSCVSKYALSTYGLSFMIIPKAARMLLDIVFVAKKNVSLCCCCLVPFFVRSIWYPFRMVITGESLSILSPFAILSLTYPCKNLHPTSGRYVKY